MVCATLLAKHWVRHSLHMGGVAVTVSLLMDWLQGVQRRLKKLRERQLVLPPDGVFLGWGGGVGGGGSMSESDSSASDVECPGNSGFTKFCTKSLIQSSLSWGGRVSQ